MSQLQNMLRVGSSLLTHDDALISSCLPGNRVSVSEFLASTWSIGSGLKVVGTPSHC